MPTFSAVSKQRLAGAHPELQRLLNAAILKYDFVILDSQRDRAGQELAFKKGNTKVHFGNSAHNWAPSVAVDIAPFPIDWNDISRFRKLQAEIIRPLAKELGIPIRQGYDWDGDGSSADESFVDWPHIELHPWRDWAKKSRPFGE